jgi:hypothetical protein
LKERSQFLKELKYIYSTPYWQKFFREIKTRGFLPRRLQLLFSTVCGSCPEFRIENLKEILSSLSLLSREELEAIVLERERAKLVLESTCLGHFDRNVDDITVIGSDENPLLFREPYRIFFRIGENVYAICSNNYKEASRLLEIELLPDFARLNLLTKIGENHRIIQQEKGDPANPETIVDFLTKELGPDHISDRTTRIELAQCLLVDSDVIQVPEYATIYELESLSIEHAKVTLIYLINTRLC